MNSRLESVRAVVQEAIRSIPCENRKQEAYANLHGVSATATIIAMNRGIDQELATIAGLLHNYYYLKTGIGDFPGPSSSEAVRPLLRDMGIFAAEEQAAVLQAIFYQEDESRIHGPNEEIVKDAKGADKRSKLADMAEALAESDIVGEPGNQRYREICQYWPDEDVHKTLQNSWCAAFVYHCCWLAGIQLPIRYPNGICRFAGVGAWLEWARLPETGFLHYDGLDGFTPQRGDIVIYERLLSDHPHDHIGIVLGCDDDEIRVAEGNRDNQNYSSVFNRGRRHCILGYIRIDNDFTYHFSGDYNPIL